MADDKGNNDGGNSGGSDDGGNAGSNNTGNNDTTTDKSQGGKSDGMTLEETTAALKESRAENAKRRNENKDLNTKFDSMQLGFKKALGIDEEGDADPAAMSKTVTDLTNRLNRADVKNSFNAVATKQKVDPELMFAVLKTNGTLDGLDPSSDSFEKDLTKAVKDALKANPKLAAATTVDKSGADMGGGGEGGKVDMDVMIRNMANRNSLTQ